LHKGGEVGHRQFRDIAEILQPGDLLVMNDTRVSALRMLGHKETGGAVEALLIREVAERQYLSLVKPGKRLKPGTKILFAGGLVGRIFEDLDEGQKMVQFEEVENFLQRLEEHGLVPLPPYIHESLYDRERYQTVYANDRGSAAAPTAGLHFTPELLADLETKGIETARVTLHVGIDTFRPVQVEDLTTHKMHGERCIVPEDTAIKINRAKGRIIAVGTTTVRTLESFAIGQRQIRAGGMESKLFIRPGFEFQIVDGMFTNFHLPKTTMLVMISAMAGRDNVMNAYREAIEHKYRLLSFGDSMLIL